MVYGGSDGIRKTQDRRTDTGKTASRQKEKLDAKILRTVESYLIRNDNGYERKG